MHNELSQDDLSTLRGALCDAFFGHGHSPSIADIATTEPHMMHRLTECRNNIVPWLAEQIDLSRSRVLEIGAGTGSTAIGFAEAGLFVDAIDMQHAHLAAAKVRAELHGIKNIAFHTINAVELTSLFAANRYDVIVFSATLEHMTIPERITSLKAAWNHLRSGGLLVVYETPNRLWYRDDHTSLRPFFHWLPDEIALHYANQGRYAGYFNDKENPSLELTRLGRGASFHEFEIAFGLDPNHVQKSMHEYLCEHHEHYRHAWESSAGKRYYDMLGQLVPLPGPWREELLNLTIQK
jgi:S-adenosylmethionine-dependent methyltransferase